MSPRAAARRLLALLVTVPLLGARCADAPPDGPLEIRSIARHRLADGIELVRAELSRGGAPGGTLHAIHAEPDKIRLDLVMNAHRVALRDLETDRLAIVNAGFFTKDWKPTGLLAAGGRSLARFVPRGGGAGSGVLVVEGGSVRLYERERFDPATAARAELAIQAGPRLVEPDGQHGIRSDNGKRRDRTVIGADTRGRLVLAVVRGPGGWASGPTLFELQRLLTDTLRRSPAPDLALRLALNLDGGPSTALHLRHPDHRVDAPEAAPVLSALVLEPRR